MRSTGVAQSFLESVNASIARKDEPHLSLPSDGLYSLEAGACECCCRCGRGAKLGRNVTKRSKSYTNLRTGISELYGLDTHLHLRQQDRPVKKKEYAAGEAPLEKLPSEVLGKQQQHVVT